jgi:hypothetical protein
VIYVFDTSSLRALQYFYPGVFKKAWEEIGLLVSSGYLKSTKEVFREIENQAITADLLAWLKNNKDIFVTPSLEEQRFVAEIFRVSHFQTLIGASQRLKGMPVADPFVIACAKHYGATVVTEEGWFHGKGLIAPKPGAAKIPNVCLHFEIPCTNLQGFMNSQGWQF